MKCAARDWLEIQDAKIRQQICHLRTIPELYRAIIILYYTLLHRKAAINKKHTDIHNAT